MLYLWFHNLFVLCDPDLGYVTFSMHGKLFFYKTSHVRSSPNTQKHNVQTTIPISLLFSTCNKTTVIFTAIFLEKPSSTHPPTHLHTALLYRDPLLAEGQPHNMLIEKGINKRRISLTCRIKIAPLFLSHPAPPPPRAPNFGLWATSEITASQVWLAWLKLYLDMHAPDLASHARAPARKWKMTRGFFIRSHLLF